jgi:hypothetical protein
MATLPKYPPLPQPIAEKGSNLCNRTWAIFFQALLEQAAASGGVSSVAMTVPSIFAVAGSPVTSSGTLAVTLATQAAAIVFAGPTSGGAATPTFRALVATDLAGLAGTYTPTLTNVANLDASTAYACQYLRVGATVTVSGKVDVDPTAAGSAQLGISLPIASNFATAQQCAGTAFAPAIAGQGAAILGDTTNDRAQMQWIAVDTTNQAMYFTFTYQVV